MTRAWRNQPHVREWFLNSDPISPDQHQAWFERYRDRDDDFVFVIEDSQSLQRPVGQIALYNIDWAARRAEFGRLMIGDDAARGKGVATRATRAILDFAFQRWDLDEVWLEMLPGNTRAARVYEMCGFEPVSGRDGLITMRTRRR